MHLKQQLRLKNAESRVQKVQTDLFSAQGDMVSGQLIEFHVSPGKSDYLFGLNIFTFN